MKQGAGHTRIHIATAIALLVTVAAARPCFADDTAARQALYQQQKKSVALAVTLEAICPIAGVGAFYAGDSDRGTLLAILSTASAGAAVGSLFWLLHLDNENPGGSAGRIFTDFESGTAWTGLVAGGAIYLLTRVSGLSLAPDAVGTFNADLHQRLGVPTPEPLRFRSQATATAALIWRF
jgi:hypothetical protein